MRALNVLQTAYRATLEEQDDTVLWMTHALRNCGADVDVLLKGNAVNYSIHNQDASGLSFGAQRQKQPPHLDHDVRDLISNGCRIFIVEEDVAELGIEPHEVLDGLTPIARGELPSLFERYDRVFTW